MFGARKFARLKTAPSAASTAPGEKKTNHELESKVDTLHDATQRDTAETTVEAAKTQLGEGTTSQPDVNDTKDGNPRASVREDGSSSRVSAKCEKDDRIPAPDASGSGDVAEADDSSPDVTIKFADGEANDKKDGVVGGVELTDGTSDDVCARDGSSGGSCAVSTIVPDVGTDESSKIAEDDRDTETNPEGMDRDTTSDINGTPVTTAELKAQNKTEDVTSAKLEGTTEDGETPTASEKANVESVATMEEEEEEEEIDFSMMEFVVVDEAEGDEGSSRKRKESDRDRRNREKRRSDPSLNRHDRSRSRRAHSRDRRHSDSHSRGKRSSRDRSGKSDGHSRDRRSSREHSQKYHDHKSDSHKSHDKEKDSKSSKTSDKKKSEHSKDDKKDKKSDVEKDGKSDSKRSHDKKDEKSDLKKSDHKKDEKPDHKKSDHKKDEKSDHKKDEKSDHKKSDHKKDEKSDHKKSDHKKDEKSAHRKDEKSDHKKSDHKKNDSKKSDQKKKEESDKKKSSHEKDEKSESKKSDHKNEKRSSKKDTSKDEKDHSKKSEHKKVDKAVPNKKSTEVAKEKTEGSRGHGDSKASKEGADTADGQIPPASIMEIARPTPKFSASGIEELDSNAVWWRWQLAEQCIVEGCGKAPQSVQSYQNHWNSMHVPKKVTNTPCPLFALSTEKSKCRVGTCLQCLHYNVENENESLVDAEPLQFQIFIPYHLIGMLKRMTISQDLAARFDGKLESIGYDDLEQHLRRYHKYTKENAKTAAASCERITRRADPPDLGFIFTDGVLHEPREGVITQPRVTVPAKVFDEWKPGSKCPVSWCKKAVADTVSMPEHWNTYHVEFVPYLLCNMCSQSRHHTKIFQAKKKMALIPHLTECHHKDVDEATAIVEKIGNDFKLVLNEEYIPVNEHFFVDDEPMHTDTDLHAEEALELSERIIQLGPMTMVDLATGAIFKWLNRARRFNVDFLGTDRGFLEMEFFTRDDVDECINDMKTFPETENITCLHLKPSKHNNVPERNPTIDIEEITKDEEKFEKMIHETLVLNPLPPEIDEQTLREKLTDVDVSLLLLPREDDGSHRGYAYAHTKSKTEDLLKVMGKKIDLPDWHRTKVGEILQIPRLSSVLSMAEAPWLKACVQQPRGMPASSWDRAKNLREFIVRYLPKENLTDTQRRILTVALRDVKWVLDEKEPSESTKKHTVSKPAKSSKHSSAKSKSSRKTTEEKSSRKTAEEKSSKKTTEEKSSRKTTEEKKAEKERDDKLRKQHATKTQADRIKQRYASLKKPAAARLPAKRHASPSARTGRSAKQPRVSDRTNQRARAPRPPVRVRPSNVPARHSSRMSEERPIAISDRELIVPSRGSHKPSVSTAASAVHLLVGLSKALGDKRVRGRSEQLVQAKGRMEPVIDNRHTCLYCDGKHLSEECPQDKQRCETCGRADHLSKDCGQWALSHTDERITKSPSIDLVCIDCGGIGHSAKTCPYNPGASTPASHDYSRSKTPRLMDYGASKSTSNDHARAKPAGNDYVVSKQSSHGYAQLKSPSEDYGVSKSKSNDYVRAKPAGNDYVVSKQSSHGYAQLKSPSEDYGASKSTSNDYVRAKPAGNDYSVSKQSSHGYVRRKSPNENYGVSKPVSSTLSRPSGSDYILTKSSGHSYTYSKPVSSDYGASKIAANDHVRPKPESSSYARPTAVGNDYARSKPRSNDYSLPAGHSNYSDARVLQASHSASLKAISSDYTQSASHSNYTNSGHQSATISQPSAAEACYICGSLAHSVEYCPTQMMVQAASSSVHKGKMSGSQSSHSSQRRRRGTLKPHSTFL